MREPFMCGAWGKSVSNVLMLFIVRQALGGMDYGCAAELFTVPCSTVFARP